MYYRCMATDVQYLHECEELIVDLKEGQGLPLPLYGWTCPIYCTGIYVCTFIHVYVCIHVYTYILSVLSLCAYASRHLPIHVGS